MDQYISFLESVINFTGVAVIIAGVIVASVACVRNAIAGGSTHGIYRSYRQNLSRVILLGLEFLIAGDIIRSVAETPTFESVSILFIIIVIRLALTWELKMEVEGRLPWQQRSEKT